MFLGAVDDIVNFFFQAEDGIRDLTVTGVQTCAFRSAFAVAVTCPAASVTAIGMPSERTWAARSRSALVAASGRGSFKPANTRPSSRLVSRASSRRCRATTQAYPTLMPPSSNASATTARGPARRRPPFAVTGRREALGPRVGRERRGKDHGAVGLPVRFEQRGDGARQRHAGGVQGVYGLGLAPGLRPAAAVGAEIGRAHV